MNQPLVSCVMPTTSERRRYIPGAIKCFLDQDYANKELVILDDGPQPVVDLMPQAVFDQFIMDERIRYVWSDTRQNIGQKLNVLCELSNGDIIVRIDDDDYSAPGRITDQVRRILTTGKPFSGYYAILFYDERDGQAWKYTGHAHYACGTSFAFMKKWWAGLRFAPLATCSDNEFLRRAGGNSLATVDGSEFIVARIHDGNSSPKSMVDMIKAGRTTCDNWVMVPRDTLPEGFRKAAGL